MDARINLLVMLLYITFGVILAYTCFFRQEILEAIYPDRMRKAKKPRLFGWPLPNQRQRYAIYRAMGLIFTMMTVVVLFSFLEALTPFTAR